MDRSSSSLSADLNIINETNYMEFKMDWMEEITKATKVPQTSWVGRWIPCVIALCLLGLCIYGFASAFSQGFEYLVWNHGLTHSPYYLAISNNI